MSEKSENSLELISAEPLWAMLIWCPQIFRIFWPPPSCQVQNSCNLVPFVCLLGTPLSPPIADVNSYMEAPLYDYFFWSDLYLKGGHLKRLWSSWESGGRTSCCTRSSGRRCKNSTENTSSPEKKTRNRSRTKVDIICDTHTEIRRLLASVFACTVILIHPVAVWKNMPKTTEIDNLFKWDEADSFRQIYFRVIM